MPCAEPPTVGANDLTAIGAMRAAQRGLVVGRDVVGIAGYDRSVSIPIRL